MEGIKASWNTSGIDIKRLVFAVCIAFVLLGAFVGVASATTLPSTPMPSSPPFMLRWMLPALEIRLLFIPVPTPRMWM
ncbi:MAG: hypothetical protein ISS94_05655 [Candidatus Syntrophoarchaeum sp.]|nr:hypothetical protein [Candidatus Syntrophoarchaeum sp.]